MTEQKVAPQIEFESLDDFIKGQNNYYAYFLDDSEWGINYRERPPFKRFQESHPEMEREVTGATVQAVRANPRQKLPYKQLWGTYKIMSDLVFVDDKYVMRDGKPDKYFLIR
ncbi:MAG: hypothetical protein KJ770_02355 [Actinobacteria bacterium]|nr:hypothetical protein [Actinomycetota bacterium]